MLPGEGVLAALPRFGHGLVLMPKWCAILDIDGEMQVGHIFGLHFCPNVIIDKKHHAVGMLGQDRNRVGVKIGQKRHHHTAIGIDAPECHRPPRGIACTDSDFVSLVDTRSLEEDAEAFYVDCQLSIGKRVAIIVTQGLLSPMIADSVLQILQIVPHNYLAFINNNYKGIKSFSILNDNYSQSCF